MSDKFLNDEQEKALEELLNLLRKMPKKKFLTLNKPRFDEAAKSISKIVKLVKEDYPDAQVTVEFDELTEASVFLTIITDGFNVYKVKDFCAAIAPANTMNFTPRLDEKLEIGVVYDDVKLPVKPQR